jgi:hypothetical protein
MTKDSLGEKVILGTTTSLDGFINDHNGSLEALHPDLAAWRESEKNNLM